MRKLLYFILLMLPASAVLAQDAATAESSAGNNLYSQILVIVFICTAVIMLLVIRALLKTIKTIERFIKAPVNEPVAASEPLHEIATPVAVKQEKSGIWERVLGLKPLAHEKDIMMEHEFDGIAELDNPTPGWFMWLFYGTIVFAASYLLYFHVFQIGKMQEEEYADEMSAAKIEQTAYLAKSAGNIDENNVKLSKEDAVISAGMATFKANCVACHGENAQGVVGPNLTDKFWLHGGSINHIFKTIKYGVPEKGMISWEKTLTPKQISEVSNYILSRADTHPANAKAPQGTEEEEED